jgi:hypothetical protein
MIRALGRMCRCKKFTLAVQKAQSPSKSRIGYTSATVRAGGRVGHVAIVVQRRGLMGDGIAGLDRCRCGLRAAT